MTLAALPWLWIPITVAAALAQTIRNATQRHLVADVGTLGATLVRFLYGLPFAVAWLVAVHAVTGDPMPAIRLGIVAWCALGAVAQILATAFLLAAMGEQNFATGVAYSKTEVIQIAVFGFVLLGELVSPLGWVAIMVATSGVLFMSVKGGEHGMAHVLLRGWRSRAAGFGLASGAAFAVSAVGYRGATLVIMEASPAAPALAAAFALAIAQSIQVVLLGGWLAARSPGVILKIVAQWRRSLFAGAMGTLASICWFTAFAIQTVAHVRTLGLVELVFSYAVSRGFFREEIPRNELIGLVLIALGVVFIVNAG